MTNTVRYGILGCGMMGREHLTNLQLIEGAEVVAILEPNSRMAERAARIAPDATFVDSISALLENNIDALVIATPNYQHAGQLLELLGHSTLPILVEKPVVTTEDQVSQIAEAAARHKAPLWVAMEYRYMPPVSAFQKSLNEGVIGKLISLSIREHRFPFLSKVNDWNRFNRNTGGTLVEKCCHFFDLMRLLTNDEVTRIYASAGQDNNHLDESYAGESPDILDNAFVVLDFQSGKRAMLDLNMFAEGSRYQEEICAIGSTGKLECFVPGPEQTWPADQPQPTPKLVISPRSPRNPVTTEITVDPLILAAGSHQGATFYEHLGFFRSITEGLPVEVTIDDGLRAVVLGLAAQKSARTSQPVNLTGQGLSFE